MGGGVCVVTCVMWEVEFACHSIIHISGVNSVEIYLNFNNSVEIYLNSTPLPELHLAWIYK